MDGTGPDMEFKETNSLSGFSGLKMLISMLPISL